MVCDKCEKKLSKVICPEVWKPGAGGRSQKPAPKIKPAIAKKRRADSFKKKGCRNCGSPVSLPVYNYCQGCSYKLGICGMCGKKILDISSYKQSSK